MHSITTINVSLLVCSYADQLNKIDDDMKKLLNDKLNILRAMQGGVRDYRSTESTPKHVPAKELDTPKAIVEAAIEQGTPNQEL